MHCTNCPESNTENFYKTKYNRQTNLCKACTIRFLKERRKYLKKLAVEYKGSKCNRCGYCKSHSAMEFHHLRDKEDTVCKLIQKMAHWDTIKVELNKCELLCSNCHRIEHNPDFNDNEYQFDHKSLLDCRKQRFCNKTVRKTCLICSETFDQPQRNGYEQKYCSQECSILAQRSKQPSYDELVLLRQTLPWRKIADMYGVKSKTAQRWMKTYKSQMESKSTRR